MSSVGARLGDARHERDERRHDHRDRQALAAVEDAAGALREQDVEPPSRRPRPATNATPTASRPPPAATAPASSTIPIAASADPDEVEPPARRAPRDRERPEELDRHRDAERDPVERLVEASGSSGRA